MRIYRGRAFTYPEKIEGCEVIGNPATVCICDKELPSEKEMSEFAVGENAPISVFVKQENDNSYLIRYYGPDGIETAICGHGTFAATRALKELNPSLEKINFNYNKSLLRSEEKDLYPDHLSIIAEELNNQIQLDLPLFNLIDLNTKEENIIHTLLEKLSIDNDSEVFKIVKCKELRDYLIVLKDCNQLRNLKPNFRDIEDLFKQLHVRCITLTAQSNNNDFDYENRVLLPHIGPDEDIACGSANCYTSRFWNEYLNKNELKCLYSYKIQDGLVGGMQYISTNTDDIIVTIKAYCS